MDSKATIEAAFDVLAVDFGVTTVWWRGAQDQIWRDHCMFRKQNRFYDQLHEWMWHLDDNEGTNRAAIEAAHKNGMKIWAVYGLLELATQADAGACIVYPYQSEDKLRIEHPEWIPVNKYGTRRQPGPIEYAYPVARKAMIDRLTKFVVDHDYDGMSFYTYVENLGLRYVDEFGYNQPIVDEFKKRYGVDIRTEDFDKEAWAKVRGEYITQFLCELAVGALSKYYMDSDVIAALLKSLKRDNNEVVQVRSATRLNSLIPALTNNSTEPAGTIKIRRKVIDELLTFFEQYGDGCTRGDADWGWRVVGNAILNFGDESEKKLQELISRKANRRLAELAWRVIYIRQKAMAYCLVTEDQDAQAHTNHPFLKIK